jgi:hypothetical protein
MSIQATALIRALGLLKVSGLPYAVIDDSGNLHTSGGYEFKQLPDPQTKGKRTFSVPRGFYKDVHYPVTSTMQPGDTRHIVVPETYDLEAVRGSTCGWASKNWGCDSYLTECDKDTRTITIARII